MNISLECLAHIAALQSLIEAGGWAKYKRFATDGDYQYFQVVIPTVQESTSPHELFMAPTVSIPVVTVEMKRYGYYVNGETHYICCDACEMNIWLDRVEQSIASTRNDPDPANGSLI